MFTGIVEELGCFESGAGGRLRFAAPRVAAGLELGASIAVNGCCLTAVACGTGWWEADAVAETLARTTLGSLSPGDPVNLERPVRTDGRLDGHIVTGHIDGTGGVVSGSPDLAVEVAERFERYVVEKGSVAIDGVSLTVVSMANGIVTVAVIPHTATNTTLGLRRPGDRVNLEFDIVAKYVEKMMPGARR